MRIDVMGVGFDSLTMDEAVARARDLMAERRAAYVVTPNPEIVMLCRDDPAAMQAVQGADLVLPDGIGVIYGAKILGTPLRAKLPGIDFASALMAQMGQEGKSVFLLGAKPGVADAAAEKMRERFPGLVIAGTNDGYFQDDDPVVEKINAAAFGEMLARARQLYDYVFLDAPAGVDAGFRLTAQFADRFLLVTGAGPAAVRDASRVGDLLELMGKKNIRLIVNRVDKSMLGTVCLTIDDVMDAAGLPLAGIVPEDPHVTHVAF